MSDKRSPNSHSILTTVGINYFKAEIIIHCMLLIPIAIHIIVYYYLLVTTNNNETLFKSKLKASFLEEE